MFGFFKEKKLYKIKYQLYCTYTTIIEAKDEYQALKKFKKEMKRMYFAMPTIISLEEI